MANVSRTTLYLIILAGAAAMCAFAVVALQGPTPASPPVGPTPSGGQLVINLPEEVWGVLFLSPLFAGWAVLVARRLTQRTVRHSLLQVVILAAVAFVLFALILSLGHGGNGSLGYATGGSGSNTTTAQGGNNTSNGGGSGGHGGSGSSGGTGTSAFHVALPSSTLLIIAGGAAVVVAVLALPGVVSRLVDRRRVGSSGGSGRPDVPRAAAALSLAEAALDRGDDPRETIVRLYLELLFVLGAQVEQLDFETAEEIRSLHLAPLGVPPPVAERLTRIFEEARYSTHAIGSETVSDAKETFHQAAAALRRGGRAPA